MIPNELEFANSIRLWELTHFDEILQFEQVWIGTSGRETAIKPHLKFFTNVSSEIISFGITLLTKMTKNGTPFSLK
jgi:hypothetical protein